MSSLRSDLIVRILCDHLSFEHLSGEHLSGGSPAPSHRSFEDGRAADAASGGNAWGPFDAAYLFGETDDNEHSVFEAAARIYREGLAHRILFSSSEPRSGYPGFGPWYTALRQIGIPEDMILGVPVPLPDESKDGSLNTFAEARALIRFCREKSFSRIAVVAAPFHQLRSFLCTVSVAAENYRTCRIYSIPGKTLPWDEDVVHHQGVERGSRFDFIASELQRIENYREAGDLLPDDVLVAYLQNRDSYD